MSAGLLLYSAAVYSLLLGFCLFFFFSFAFELPLHDLLRLEDRGW